MNGQLYSLAALAWEKKRVFPEGLFIHFGGKKSLTSVENRTTIFSAIE
jgi:hypothetical protein